MSGCLIGGPILQPMNKSPFHVTNCRPNSLLPVHKPSVRQPSIQYMCFRCLCFSKSYCSIATSSRICLWPFFSQMCSVSRILCLKLIPLICKKRHASVLEQPLVPPVWYRWPAHVVMFCESHESGYLSPWIMGAIGASGLFEPLIRIGLLS